MAARAQAVTEGRVLQVLHTAETVQLKAKVTMELAGWWPVPLPMARRSD